MIVILLNLAESQLAEGFSVVVDSVFMGDDRLIAKEIAARQQALFFPFYTYLSDETIWEARVQQRWEEASDEIKEQVATWERIQEQRKSFLPWSSEEAFFVDGVNPVEGNLEDILRGIASGKRF